MSFKKIDADTQALLDGAVIRIIDGMVQPDSGEVELGETIKIGYFAQEVPDMDTNQRVIDLKKFCKEGVIETLWQ